MSKNNVFVLSILTCLAFVGCFATFLYCDNYYETKQKQTIIKEPIKRVVRVGNTAKPIAAIKPVAIKTIAKPKQKLTKQQIKSAEIIERAKLNQKSWKLVVSGNNGYKMYKRDFRDRTEYKQVRKGEEPYITTYHRNNF